MDPNTSLRTDVDELRSRVTDTRELYREVCALMFFRYGQTPTGNKLYQLVRKGSMNVPAEELARFWDALREKSRVRIDHPDLPDELKQVAADAVQAVWRQATELARDQWSAARLHAEASVAAASEQAETARAQMEGLEAKLQEQAAQLQEMDLHRRSVGLELEAERCAHAATTARMDALRQQVAELLGLQDQQRQTFSDELSKVRGAVEAADARAVAAEHRALREIDQERQARNVAEKRVDATAAKLKESEQRAQAAALLAATASARISADFDAAQRSAAELGAQVDALRHDLALARADASRESARADTLQALAAQFQPASPRTSQKGTKTHRSKTVEG